MKLFFSILISLVLYIPVSSYAEIKEIITEGTYSMGDGETPSVAESLALLNAKRVALEQAGTYVESYSKVEGIVLTKDEMHVLASGLMEVQLLDKKRSVVRDGFIFWVKIKAKVNTAGLIAMADRVKEKALMEDYKKLQASYDNSQREIEKLKQQLQKTNNRSLREQVQAKIAEEEKLFQAKQLYEMGVNYHSQGDFDKSIDAFSRAITLNAKYVEALYARGVIYKKMDKFDKAIEDFNDVISLSPNKAFGYFQRGSSYLLQDEYDKALSDYDKAIAIDPDDYDKYYSRGMSYQLTEQYEKAILNYNKAILLNPKHAKSYLNRGYAYIHRGDKNADFFNDSNNYVKGIADFSKAIALDPDESDAFVGRGTGYGLIGNGAKCTSDLQKACDLGNRIGCMALNSCPK